MFFFSENKYIESDPICVLFHVRTDLEKSCVLWHRGRSSEWCLCPSSLFTQTCCSEGCVLTAGLLIPPPEGPGKVLPAHSSSWKLHTPHWALLVPSAGFQYQLSLLINSFALCQKFSPDILYLQVKSSTAYVLSLSQTELVHFVLS